ncbi:MAG: hypothetical protein ACRD6W_02870, partial [Nitrososphaerales archaeon]
MMTAKTKTATVAAVALTFVALFLAYSAFVAPASAQPAATSSTSSSSASSTPTSTTSNTNAPSGPGQWTVSVGPGGFGRGGPFQGGQMRGGYGAPQQQANLTVGQTITISSTQGEYLTTGSTPTNGTASGNVTFTVTGKLSEGYTLSIASGSVLVNGTSYTLSSGSAQMDRAATTLTGQGTTTPSGSFIIQASARGSFVGSTATVLLDLGA